MKKNDPTPFIVPFIIAVLILISEPSGIIGIIAGIGFYAIIIYWIVSYNAKKKKLKRSDVISAATKYSQEDKRKDTQTIIDQYISFQSDELTRIRKSILIFNEYENSQNNYFTYKQHQRWKGQYSDLFDKIKDNTLRNTNLDSEDLNSIKSFKRLYHYCPNKVLLI